MFDGADEDFAVADLFGLRGRYDGLDGGVYLIVVQHDFDFYLGQKIYDIFSATVQFCMALLTPEAFDFDNAKALNANLLERLLDFIKLERLDYSFDLLDRKSVV